MLEFTYKPEKLYPPVHQVSIVFNDRIKDFYRHLWFGYNERPPLLNFRETFTGPEVTILASDVEEFCTVVGNLQEEFKVKHAGNVKPTAGLRYRHRLAGHHEGHLPRHDRR